jgi:hypothetical protein
MKEDSVACITNVGDQTCIHNGRDHLGDTGVDGRIILKLDLRKQDVEMWSAFRWHKEAQWRTVVNTVINTRVP